LVTMSHESVSRFLQFSDPLAIYLSSFNFTTDSVLFLTNQWLTNSFNNVFRVIVPSSSISERIQHALVPLRERVGWVGGSNDLKALRSLVLFWSAYFGDPETLAKAKNIWNNDNHQIAPDIQRVVYYTVASDPKSYELLVKMYLTTTDNQEKDALSFALTSSPDTQSACERCRQFIRTYINSTRAQITAFGVTLSYSNLCREFAWQQIKELSNIAWKSDGAAATSTIINSFNGVFSTTDKYNEVAQFLNNNYVTRDQANQVLLVIKQNMDLVHMNQEFSSSK